MPGERTFRRLATVIILTLDRRATTEHSARHQDQNRKVSRGLYITRFASNECDLTN